MALTKHLHVALLSGAKYENKNANANSNRNYSCDKRQRHESGGRLIASPIVSLQLQTFFCSSEKNKKRSPSAKGAPSHTTW